MILEDRLQMAFRRLGYVRIPEILHHHAEEASRNNISYLEFLDNLLQEEITAKNDRYIQMRRRMAHLPFTRHSRSLTSRFSRRLIPSGSMT